MLRRLGMMMLLAVCCAAPVAAWAQTSRPAVVDAYTDVPLPTRRAAATQAAGAGSKATSSSDPLDTKRVVLAMAVVLGAIFAAHLVWRRLGMPGGGSKASGALQVVSRMTISPKQQLLLVRVGRRCVLVANSGAQMSALCEIGDPDEVAGLLGESAPQKASSFDEVLGGESQRFEEDVEAQEAHAAEEEQALSATRDELSGMMEKVRGLSKQFSSGVKG